MKTYVKLTDDGLLLYSNRIYEVVVQATEPSTNEQYYILSAVDGTGTISALIEETYEVDYARTML